MTSHWPTEPLLPTGPAHLSVASVATAWQRVRQQLLANRTADGHWVGQLSTSALSTATAISAWSVSRRHCTAAYLARQAEIDRAIDQACHWLLDSQNSDGGFGDTDLSHSNIATSLLVLAAWQLADFHEPATAAIERGWAYCERVGKWDALRRRYGKDKTFVAPILTNCALAGIVSWDEVPTLPFEAAWLPQSWYRLARLPVVSYAVPALVAIGQAKFHHRPPNPLWKPVRAAALQPTLQVLQRMQPASGGYLEAVPLTSFVLMCLADIGQGDHPVASSAIRFLLESRLPDGSLPIDTNLATWVTSLSISALDYACQPVANCEEDSREEAIAKSSTVAVPTLRWLLSCQHWAAHPFTGAKPGGWGWSDLSGAVPDADDTPAALLALARWGRRQAEVPPILASQIRLGAVQGLRWLMQLQNRDGGWPTFCRGWGKLPFDRSGTDLTAHALRAVRAWHRVPAPLRHADLDSVLARSVRAVSRGFDFLEKRQDPSGCWYPLWFGNQDRADEENPVYGTAKVLLAYADYERGDEPCRRGLGYLVEHQNPDGGWGGGPSVPYRVASAASAEQGSSVEETAWALEALLSCGSMMDLKPTIMRALDWLVSATMNDCALTPWPIGFYFAKLWYHERLYPQIAATAALGAAVEHPDYWLNSP